MDIHQFEDKHLSHYSYAILDEEEKKIMLIDPARNPQPYLDYARKHNAVIEGIIETHPHADFVSSHLELNCLTNATIYTSQLVDAYYTHEKFDEGHTIVMGDIRLHALNTPGHSPDSISVLLEYKGKQRAVFTGDTLFINDCGRPDLREGAGKMTAAREIMARQMYHTLRDKFLPLRDDVIVYPAHGAGTLCGKNPGKASSATMGNQKKENWALQPQSESEFVEELLRDQPFVPAYFGYDVDLNRKGAPAFQASLKAVSIINENELENGHYVIDVRDEEEFKKGHHRNAINLMLKGKFETWLGSIIKPFEKFYLTAGDKDKLWEAMERTASIGYETHIAAAFVTEDGNYDQEEIDVEEFSAHTDDYTIVDVRNRSEVQEGKLFNNAIPIPLAELRGRADEIPVDKPIVVHCAGGYRSAAGSSLLQSKLDGQAKVFDLGEAVKKFKKEPESV